MAPISNDLLLAAALTGVVPAAAAQPAPAAGRPQSGVVTTVKSAPVPSSSSTTIYIDNTANQKLTTDANSTIHVLFSDQSAVTVGPNSELVIAKYQFEPKAKEGQILIEMTKGLLRVVGGLISKKSETVVRTATGTVGIRGGITLVETNNQITRSTFLFGQSMRASSNGGDTQTVTRQGFGTSFDVDGLGTTQRIPSSDLSSMLQRMEGPQSNGGPGNQPNNQSPAPSGQLLSTGNLTGGSNPPGGSLSNDRLKNTVDNNANFNPSLSLKTLLTTSQVQNAS